MRIKCYDSLNDTPTAMNSAAALCTLATFRRWTADLVINLLNKKAVLSLREPRDASVSLPQHGFSAPAQFSCCATVHFRFFRFIRFLRFFILVLKVFLDFSVQIDRQTNSKDPAYSALMNPPAMVIRVQRSLAGRGRQACSHWISDKSIDSFREGLERRDFGVCNLSLKH